MSWKKKKKNSSCFNNIIPTLTLPLTLRCLFSFSDVEHSRSGQWSYLPLPAPAVFSGRKAQYLRREFFFSPLRPEHFYQVKSWISSFATRIFYHQNISDFTTRITFFLWGLQCMKWFLVYISVEKTISKKFFFSKYFHIKRVNNSWKKFFFWNCFFNWIYKNQTIMHF